MEHIEDFINLANNVKKYRLMRGYTQEVFAEKINKTVNFLSLLENAHVGITVYTLIEIAKALEVPTSKLLEPCDKVSGRIKNYKKVTH